MWFKEGRGQNNRRLGFDWHGHLQHGGAVRNRWQVQQYEAYVILRETDLTDVVPFAYGASLCRQRKLSEIEEVEPPGALREESKQDIIRSKSESDLGTWHCFLEIW